jgi:hypothetical protein
MLTDDTNYGHWSSVMEEELRRKHLWDNAGGSPQNGNNAVECIKNYVSPEIWDDVLLAGHTTAKDVWQTLRLTYENPRYGNN